MSNAPDSLLLINSIKYLQNVSELLPSHLHTLKSLCSSKSRILELKGHVHMPAKSGKCPKCCIKFEDGQPKFKIVREQKLSSFGKKVAKKIKNGQPLTKFQTRYCKKLKNPSCNVLVKTCSFCGKEISGPFKKSLKIGIENSEEIRSKPSKRKRNQDKFCGLNQQAVLAATPKLRTQKNNIIEEINLITPNIPMPPKPYNKINNRKKKVFPSTSKETNNQQFNGQKSKKGKEKLNKTINQPLSKKNKQKNKKKLNNLTYLLEGNKSGKQNISKLKHFLTGL